MVHSAGRVTDGYYTCLQNWSATFDLQIITVTCSAFSSKNAYRRSDDRVLSGRQEEPHPRRTLSLVVTFRYWIGSTFQGRVSVDP